MGRVLIMLLTTRTPRVNETKFEMTFRPQNKEKIGNIIVILIFEQL